MKIVIELDVYDEFIDEDDETGLTEEAHLALSTAVSSYGDIEDIRSL